MGNGCNKYRREDSSQYFRKFALPYRDLLDQRVHPSVLRHIQGAHVTTHGIALVHLVQNKEWMRAQTILSTSRSSG